MTILFRIAMLLLGACLGSFLCCQARRIHIKETTAKKRKTRLGNRSVCLNCHKKLKWYDNIPIISWLALSGKCRYCHKKIGILEILSEVLSAVSFLLISITINPLLATPLDWAIFTVSIILTSVLLFLAIYDGAYGELPTLCLTIAIICAIILASLKIWASLSVVRFSPDLLLNPIFAAAVLGGLYLILYLVSKGKWVGDGDWFLGTAIAIALGSPWLALIALFVANFTACIVMYPVIKSSKPSKSKRKASTLHKIHLGPFLVAAFVLVYPFATQLIALINP